MGTLSSFFFSTPFFSFFCKWDIPLFVNTNAVHWGAHRQGTSQAMKKVEHYTVRKVTGDGRCMFRALVCLSTFTLANVILSPLPSMLLCLDILVTVCWTFSMSLFPLFTVGCAAMDWRVIVKIGKLLNRILQLSWGLPLFETALWCASMWTWLL